MKRGRSLTSYCQIMMVKMNLEKKNYIYVYMPIKIDLDCEKKKKIQTPLPSSPCNQTILSLGSSLIPRPSTTPSQVEMENKSSSLLFLCFHTFFSFLCLPIVLKYFLSYLKAFLSATILSEKLSCESIRTCWNWLCHDGTNAVSSHRNYR